MTEWRAPFFFHGPRDTSEHWKAGTNISNLFDSVHYEAFGGDLLGRRALVYVAVDWKN